MTVFRSPLVIMDKGRQNPADPGANYPNYVSEINQPNFCVNQKCCGTI